MGVLTDAINKIGEAAADFSSLTVTTYSGDIKLMVQEASRPDPADDDSGATAATAFSGSFTKMDFDKLFKYAVDNAVDDGNVGASGTVTVMAVNVHKIDGDAVVYRHPEIDPKLQQAHDAALTAGRETREGILNLVKGALS